MRRRRPGRCAYDGAVLRTNYKRSEGDTRSEAGKGHAAAAAFACSRLLDSSCILDRRKRKKVEIEERWTRACLPVSLAPSLLRSPHGGRARKEQRRNSSQQPECAQQQQPPLLFSALQPPSLPVVRCPPPPRRRRRRRCRLLRFHCRFLLASSLSLLLPSSFRPAGRQAGASSAQRAAPHPPRRCRRRLLLRARGAAPTPPQPSPGRRSPTRRSPYA